jgi:protein O-mannosyl-transferase
MHSSPVHQIEARPLFPSPAPRRCGWICLLLACGTAALYLPVIHFPFINFDDGDYLTENPVTQAGLTWPGFLWAFNGIHVGNWHPLAWLSHEMDCQLFGLHAGGHHLVNVLFHVTNTLLLFVFLRGATGAEWRSAVVAALFAWHPLHVESVAWVAERKDVLCGFFWLLSLLAYARYAEGAGTSQTTGSKLKSKNSKFFYALALLAGAAALLSKPMAVTLPFTLFLVDVWPLKRIQNSEFRMQNFKRLLAEKIPFFTLAFGLCLITFLVQRSAGAVSPVALSSRAGNAVVGYARYLSKTFWPTDLAIVYPYVYQWPVAAIAGSVILLATFSALAFGLWRNKPWFTAGWFWFLGTLVPVIGFVQVGAQSMADRYSYMPSIGFFILVVWGAADFLGPKPRGDLWLTILGGAALTGCVLVTARQISCWRSSQDLFLHAIAVTQNNYVAENALGKSFESAGDLPRALVLYRDAVKIEPRYASSQYNYGLALIGIGQKDAALEHLAAAAKLDPDNPDAQFNLGVFFLQQKHFAEAAGCLQATLKLRPASAMAHYRLGQALTSQAKFNEAAAEFRTALRLQTHFPEAQQELADLLAAHPPLAPP